MAVVVRPSAVQFAIIRLAQGDTPAALKQVEKAWRSVNPRYPFEYQFFDDDYAESYSQYEQMGKLFRWFSALAVVVACLGLFGLASFLAEQRRKEIGVRKVLGASEGQVIRLAHAGIRQVGSAGEFRRLAGGLFRGPGLAPEVFPTGRIFRRFSLSWPASPPWPSPS